MKIFVVLLICSAVTAPVFSQSIPPSTILLGGTLGFSRQKADNNGTVKRNTLLNLNPSVAKFYATNRAAGININFNQSTAIDNNSKNKNYGGGIFFRQYLPVAKSLYVFGEEGASFLSGKFNTVGLYTEDIKTSTASVYFYPGLAYGITRRFHIEIALNDLVQLNYTKQKTITDNNGSISRSSYTSYGLQMGISNAGPGYLSFGAKWLLIPARSN